MTTQPDIMWKSIADIEPRFVGATANALFCATGNQAIELVSREWRQICLAESLLFSYFDELVHVQEEGGLKSHVDGRRISHE